MHYTADKAEQTTVEYYVEERNEQGTVMGTHGGGYLNTSLDSAAAFARTVRKFRPENTAHVMQKTTVVFTTELMSL